MISAKVPATAADVALFSVPVGAVRLTDAVDYWDGEADTQPS